MLKLKLNPIYQLYSLSISPIILFINSIHQLISFKHLIRSAERPSLDYKLHLSFNSLNSILGGIC